MKCNEGIKEFLNHYPVFNFSGYYLNGIDNNRFIQPNRLLYFE